MSATAARLRGALAARGIRRQRIRGWLDRLTAVPIAALVRRRKSRAPKIQSPTGGEITRVESYWGRHTVDTSKLWTRRASERQLEWRFAQYPLFREFSGLWGNHDGEVILDYGCGPGNDLTGFA